VAAAVAVVEAVALETGPVLLAAIRILRGEMNASDVRHPSQQGPAIRIGVEETEVDAAAAAMVAVAAVENPDRAIGIALVAT